MIILFFAFVAMSFYIADRLQPIAATEPPDRPTYIKLEVPKGWPTPSFNIFAGNPLTEEGFTLGRKLFYDGRLSKDGNFACASCHQQYAAFANYDHDLSHGFNNSFSKRNAPVLFNLAWTKLLQWDGAINHIEVQPLAPMTAANEMAENIDSVLNKLKQDPDYPRLFKAAFGSTQINSKRMLKALAQFTGSIISANSKYDKYKRGEIKFNQNELKGYEIFKEKCVSCHTEPLFTDNSFRNNGLALNSFAKDVGRMQITNDPADSLKFKVPTLRNVVLSFPYMHDGRLYTLGQVIDHYTTGIQTNQPTLDPLLVNRIPITKLEKSYLLNFLYALTDTAFTHNPRYSPN